MVIPKAAATFYFTLALLKTCRHYLQDLIEMGDVRHQLKSDLKDIIKPIDRLEDRSNKSLQGTSDANKWGAEWTEKDYNSFAVVLSYMCDMNEAQRLVMEQFARQVSRGEATAELGED